MARLRIAEMIAVAALVFPVTPTASLQTTSADDPRSDGIRLTLLLDTSNSMRGMIRNVRAAGATVVQNLGERDLIQIMTFAGKVELVQKFTSSHKDLTETILEIPDASGTSALYNALYVALKSGSRDDGETRPHVIVIISDGDDTSSRISPSQIEEAAEDMPARIYSVVIPTGRPGSRREEDRFLTSLAESTGARSWKPRNIDELKSACEALALELKRLSSIE